jgi:EpsI family protein
MQDTVSVQRPGGELVADEAQVRGENVELLVWSWYLMGDISTANDYEAKLQQIMARLGFRETGAYRIVVATAVRSSLADTRSRLQEFLDMYAPLLYQELRQTAVIAR